MCKRIIGLDLGTTSIGWAFVKEAETENEHSSIVKLGVRVNPLTTDEQTNFEKGKPVSVNADRTDKRGARRNLQRYKLRRDTLVKVLKEHSIISDKTILSENEKNTTHKTYATRAKAAIEEVGKEELARIFLMINKKRGYRSSRKAKSEDEGQIIDGMVIAKRLYDEALTPGQLCFMLLREGQRYLPDFYRSDLQAEFEKVWNEQRKYHPEIFTDVFKKELEGKGQKATAASFWGKYGFNTAENKGTREEKRLRAYEWRSIGTSEQLTKEEAAFVITDINNNINSSSGYLGAISDRSKELFFNRATIGTFLYKQLKDNPNARLKNQVFYRQDYLDEFDIIWERQAKYHAELTPDLKHEIRDIIIFYQRKLKSQKALVSYCEFESEEKDFDINGKTKSRVIGYKVSPKSSPLFQEFKIWQNLNSLRIIEKSTKQEAKFDQEAKQALFAELNIKGNLSKDAVLGIVGYKPKEWDLNFASVEGNRTQQKLYEAYIKMMSIAGHDDVDVSLIDSIALKKIVADFFETQGIDKSILEFEANLDCKNFEQQKSYQLWHLLYSYDGDESATGNERLYTLLNKKFGFIKDYAQVLANIPLQQEYGGLSAKAMRKIFPFIKEHIYSDACKLAGYNHSNYLSKEENEMRELKDKLTILPKNSLRNPIVEKILNQMVNVVNAIIADPNMGKPDEIRIELARELKKNAKEREEMTTQINKANNDHDRIRKLLIDEDGIKNPTRNDIIRYKLYEELKINGYKTLYSNTYIPREKLFSKEFDIEHIIPKALLFDDSYSNKTICARQENLDKANTTAYDFVEKRLGKQALEEYVGRVEMMYKAKDGAITKAKYKKLVMKANEIGEGFIERDLRDSQYIAKKARQMLLEICRTVIPTTGSITARLREDWNLVNVMQELNFEKYKKLGLTEMVEKKDGGYKERIVDWSKRNDHRHHAMDALTIAFTKHNHIQYLNYLNARKDETHKMHANVVSIEQKETELLTDDDGKLKRKFKEPIPNFRMAAKKHMLDVLVSYKAKNKVVTKNKNIYRNNGGVHTKTQLTPRGQLHKETVYGKLKQYASKDEKVSGKFDRELINKVASEKYRTALLQRLIENGNDAKKAFAGKNSIDKKPIYMDEAKTQAVPEKIKITWLEDDYTIRKEVTPENFKDEKSIEKIIDVGVRRIMGKRLENYKGAAKEAFSNLEKNPIWLDKDKGIAVKRVTISGIKNAEALHYKKDHLGNYLLDADGNRQPVDYVSTGNNHHVAIYRDRDSELQEQVVSFYEAVERANQGIPIVDKTYNQHYGWQFLFTMKQNEYFVFPAEGFDPAEIDLTNEANYARISPNLYRVQKIATKNYFFRHHLETNVEERKELKGITYKPQLGLGGIIGIVKVRINHIGQIIKTGEY